MSSYGMHSKNMLIKHALPGSLGSQADKFYSALAHHLSNENPAVT